LFSTSYDDTIRLWAFDEACEDWIEIYSIASVHSSTIWSLDFDPTGQFLCTCSDDLSIAFFRIAGPNGEILKEATTLGVIKNAHKRAIYSITWSKCGKFVATGGSDNSI